MPAHAHPAPTPAPSTDAAPDTGRLSRHAAATFATRWASVSEEKSSAQSYWADFFRRVLGWDDLRDAGVSFEHRIRSASTGRIQWIDCLVPGVVLIEAKSRGKSLDTAEAQARDYLVSLPAALRSPVLIVCDFGTWRVVDVLAGKSHEFALADLPDELDRIERIFSADPVDAAEVQVEVDRKAAALMTALYRELARTGYPDHASNILLARLMFLMFGDDTGMFPAHGRGLFHEYLLDSREDGADLGGKLAALFSVLNKPYADRQTNLPEHLARFPFVGGGLFAETIEPPVFDTAMRAALLQAAGFDWSGVDSAIFGAMFEGVKSKTDRHSGGEFYTSVKNILKVIRPLFLDAYEQRMWEVWHDPKALERLRLDLGKGLYLDPAAGCGNFLIVAYRELRHLETQIVARIAQLNGTYGQPGLFAGDPAVSLAQFHAIEIEEWPATIARTALYLTEHQANRALDEITGASFTRLPLDDGARIVVGNALRIDWSEVCPMTDDTRILGNPPFLGRNETTPEQKADQKAIWGDTTGAANLDFVANWHLLAARHLARTQGAAALVSTNSIAQGTQPAVLGAAWAALGVGIDFAHRSFSWDNAGARVHCVIVGFSSRRKPATRPLWDYPEPGKPPVRRDARRINAYLLDAPEVLVGPRKLPVSELAPRMRKGSQPTDEGHLSNISDTAAESIRQADPVAAKYLRRLIGAEELINGRERYCLWLADADPAEIRTSPELRRRVAAVREMRKASRDAATRAAAERPAEFQWDRQPRTPYLAIPCVVSERRDYFTVAAQPAEVIASNLLLTVEGDDRVCLGLVSSRAFRAWIAAVSGRLESRYRVSAEVTYNNFPWPELTDASRAAIEAGAQGVLDARANHPGSTLADLYDPLAMPSDLRSAHKVLDRAVLAAYGLPASASDGEILELLFTRYAELVEAEKAASAGKGAKAA